MDKQQRLENGPITQGDYERVVDEAAELRMRKVLMYGEDRYFDQHPRRAMMLCYADVYRKTIRLWQLIGAGSKDEPSGDTLRDTFMDLANYGLMGVQLFDLFRGEPKAEPSISVSISADTEKASSSVGLLRERLRLLRHQIGELVQEKAASQEQAELQHGLTGHLIQECTTLRSENEGLRAALKGMAALKAQPAPVSGPRIDQVAFASNTPERLRQKLGRIFDLTEWSEDEVSADGFVRGNAASNKADLAFNYELLKPGMEFEVLHYTEGKNWLGDGRNVVNPFLSHLGIHVDDFEPYQTRLLTEGYSVVQQVKTASHTNPAIKDSRRYHYMIFETRFDLGFDIKLIKRLPVPTDEQAAPQTYQMAAGQVFTDGQVTMEFRIPGEPAPVTLTGFNETLNKLRHNRDFAVCVSEGNQRYIESLLIEAYNNGLLDSKAV